jgi:hypothetical protein
VPDHFARTIAAASFGVAVLALTVSAATFCWNWTRSRRKLTLEARFVDLLPTDPSMALGLFVLIRNPRTVPIGWRRVSIRYRTPDGTSLDKLLLEDRTEESCILTGGDEYRHEVQLPTDVGRVDLIYAVDNRGRVWSTRRVKGRRLLKRWLAAK